MGGGGVRGSRRALHRDRQLLRWSCHNRHGRCAPFLRAADAADLLGPAPPRRMVPHAAAGRERAGGRAGERARGVRGRTVTTPAGLRRRRASPRAGSSALEGAPGVGRSLLLTRIPVHACGKAALRTRFCQQSTVLLQVTTCVQLHARSPLDKHFSHGESFVTVGRAQKSPPAIPPPQPVVANPHDSLLLARLARASRCPSFAMRCVAGDTAPLSPFPFHADAPPPSPGCCS